MSLDEHVFNTEAHPFYVGFETERHEKLRQKYGFHDLDSKMDRSGEGMGTVLQAWASVDVEKLSEDEKVLYNQMIGI